jgi:hypothetical protein
MAAADSPNAAGGRKHDDRPIVVLIDPKWNFNVNDVKASQSSSGGGIDQRAPKAGGADVWDSNKLNSSMPVDVAAFFAEAKVTEDHVNVLRARFSAHAVSDPEVSDEPFLTFDSFHRLNEHYDICRPVDEEHFFRAMDRGRQYRLGFQDFLFGCAASSPDTPHILNSYTGYVRALYIFDFYNASRSGTLEYEEIARLLADSRTALGESPEDSAAFIRRTMQDLGQVEVVNLRINGLSGHIHDVRASKRWTGLRVRREIARFVDMPAEFQQLFVGGVALLEDTCLDTILQEDATSVDVSLIRVVPEWAGWPALPMAAEEVTGIERFIHVPFESLYNALVSEQLRGTSRLFRLQRHLLHKRSKGGRRAPYALPGGEATVGGGAGAVGGA